MQKILVTAAAIALGASLSAQAYTYSPAGINTVPGNTSGLNYGLYLTVWGGHVQHADTRLKGTATAMMEFCWRSSKARTYSLTSGLGRSFTNWAMRLGHTDSSPAKWSSKFTMNPIGAMTTVYSGAFKLPNHTANTTGQPWGDMGCVKFSKIFMYNGKADLLEDYFSIGGGALANGYTASIRAYYHDNCFSRNALTALSLFPGSTTAPGSKYLPHTPFNRMGKNCTDSGQTTTWYDAYSYLSGTLYKSNYRLTSLRCKIRVFSSFARYMGKSSKFIGALTVGGSDAGVAIPGAKCQKLHANMGFPLAIIGGTTTTAGHTANAFSSANAIPVKKSYVGICVYWQHAWTDTKTKQLALTVASKVCVPDKDKKDRCQNGYAYVYRYKTSKTDTTYSPSNTDASYGFKFSSTTSTFLNVYKRIRTK